MIILRQIQFLFSALIIKGRDWLSFLLSHGFSHSPTRDNSRLPLGGASVGLCVMVKHSAPPEVKPSSIRLMISFSPF